MATLTALVVGAAAQTTQTGTLQVSGMHCGACAATVEKAAKKVEGVAAVKASQPDGMATVTYDPVKTTLDAVAKAINAETPFKAETPKKGAKK
jgi:copper chaperone CopZ